MSNPSWNCPKCGNSGYQTDQIAATGGGITKFLDVQNKKFNTISCTNCGYTEFYRAETSGIENPFDLFLGR